MRLADRVERQGREYSEIAHILLFYKVESHTSERLILTWYRFIFADNKNKQRKCAGFAVAQE